MVEGQAGRSDVRSDLVARLGMISGRAAGQSMVDLAGEIAAIRRIAHRNGLLPAVAVTQVLESALARGERGPLIQGWLSILDDAIGCERHDRAACETFAAACSVRLAG